MWTYEVHNELGENCSNSKAGQWLTTTDAYKDLYAARSIRPDMRFFIAQFCGGRPQGYLS